MWLLLALTPIAFILVGIVILKKPAAIVSLLALIYTFLMAWLLWKTDAYTADVGALLEQSKKGIISALQTLFLIWGAFTLLEVMNVSGAMDRTKMVISSFAKDKRLQVVIIAFCFGAFLEGVAGAGTPAAIAAPFLVGLGFDPMVAATAALIANGVPSSFGGAGVSTIAGFGGIVTDTFTIDNVAAMTGRIHMFGALIVPFIILFVVFGKGCLKKLMPYMLTVCISMGITLFLVSNYLGPELTSILTGTVGLIVSFLYVKFIKVPVVPEFAADVDMNLQSEQSAVKSFFPYIALMILLPVIRFNVPLKTLMTFGYPTWVGAVIHGVVIVSSFIFGCQKKWFGCWIGAAKKIIPAVISMCSLLALANIMNYSGMMSLIAKTMANAGAIYPALAVVIGTLGSFMTGSTLGSNAMFGPLHMETSGLLSINPYITTAANSTGGALGNMLCPNNVIAVGTTVGLTNQEGTIMKRTMKAYAIIAVIYMAVTMLYTYVLFPNFGV